MLLQLDNGIFYEFIKDEHWKTIKLTEIEAIIQKILFYTTKKMPCKKKTKNYILNISSEANCFYGWRSDYQFPLLGIQVSINLLKIDFVLPILITGIRFTSVYSLLNQAAIVYIGQTLACCWTMAWIKKIKLSCRLINYLLIE